MNPPDHAASAAAPLDASPDFKALIASLRAAGADRFDPVRLHYIEVLARRADTHHGSVRRMLDARLAQALAALKEGVDRAQCDARDIVVRSARQFPHAAKELQQQLAAGDFKGLRRLAATLQDGEPRPSLRALVRQLEQHAPEHALMGSEGCAKVRPEGDTGARPELKTLRDSRTTWSKLSVDRQVAKALAQAPTNAGPINSHMLMLRSLSLMRDISPDYLNRFMSYADTLLSLEQGEQDKPAEPKKRRVAKAPKNKAP